MSERPPNPPHNETELVALISTIDVAAPSHVHDSVQAMVAARGGARGERGPLVSRWLAVGALAGAAAIALALILALGSSGGSFTLNRASALTLSPATLPAPQESHGSHTALAADVEGVSFPYWGGRLGWHASGARRDTLAGRQVQTVFYSDARGQRIGYAIVAGTPAPDVTAGSQHWRNDTDYRLTSLGGAEVVSWMRDGRLCVISGRDVGARTLLALASWGTSA